MSQKAPYVNFDHCWECDRPATHVVSCFLKRPGQDWVRPQFPMCDDCVEHLTGLGWSDCAAKIADILVERSGGYDEP